MDSENNPNFCTTCSIHNNIELCSYCKIDNMLICNICMHEAHANHSTCKIDDIYEEKMQQVDNITKECNTEVNRLKDGLDIIQNNMNDININCDTVEKEVRCKFDEIIQVVRNSRMQILCEIDTIRRRKESFIQHQIKDIESKIHALTNSLSQLHNTNYVKAVSAFTRLESHL